MASRIEALRQALDFCSGALARLGLSSLSAEELRKAKFNQAEAGPFWYVLHDMCLAYAHQLLPKDHMQFHGLRFWQIVHGENSDAEMPWAGTELVMTVLCLSGFPLASQLLQRRDTVCSRLLLIAFGWLASKCDIFAAVLGSQLGLLRFQHLPPYPQDAGSCKEEDALQAMEMADMCSQEMLNLGASRPGWHQVEAGSHHALMLLGRTRATLAQLAQAQQARVRQLGQLSQLQRDWAAVAGSKPAGGLLSPYELSLLLNPSALESHRQDMETAAAAVSFSRASQSHAEVFFEWMGSVVAEHHQEAAQSRPRPQPQHPAGALHSQAQAPTLRIGPSAMHVDLPKLLETCQVLDQQLQRQLPHSPCLADKHATDVCCKLSALGLQQSGPAVIPCPTLDSWQSAMMSAYPVPSGAEQPDLPGDVKIGIDRLRRQSHKGGPETSDSWKPMPQTGHACRTVQYSILSGHPGGQGTAAATEVVRLRQQARIIARQLARTSWSRCWPLRSVVYRLHYQDTGPTWTRFGC
ncbi:hypothetical protein WJX84_005732 [Apatococcus fuscideae]|uniref:Tubulin epsilon and delta complex protein 1 domain-containing protein n=1 Tax=Apatococcus fuscideae TaxID=2026836 RepID=A0AAW1SKQ5_9CHLO